MDTHLPPGRYHRQTLLRAIGQAGQERLGNAHVLLVGCGALGTVMAEYLVRAGVGNLRIIDRDIVELTNLQRQTLFDEEDVRQELPKAIAAANRLRRINSSITIEPVVADLHARNVEQFLLTHDSSLITPHLILDGTDNGPTRYLLNDAAVRWGIPWIYGGAVGMEGRVMPIVPGVGPCLRCLFPTPPAGGELATCDTAGILGPLAGIVASMQAGLAIRMLATGPASVGRELLTMDLASHRFRTLSTADARREDCPCCGLRRFEFLESPTSGSVNLCGRNAVQIYPNGPFEMVTAMARLRTAGRLENNPYFARCRLDDPQGLVLTVFPDGRLIVQGTNDLARARSIASRFVSI
jgi:molybdopterin/thiamine biosynthesis adenylyltransferase